MSVLGLTAALALLVAAALGAVAILAAVLVGLHRLEATTVVVEPDRRR